MVGRDAESQPLIGTDLPVDYRKHDREVWEGIFQEAPDSWRSAPPSALMLDCCQLLASHAVTRVLDLGSGFGRWTNFVAEEAGCSVVGLDYAFGGGLLGSRLGSKIARSSFVNGEITNLPFGDSTFDGVIAVLILDNVSEPDGRAAIRELARVVRPGSPGFVVLNPSPMPSSAETEGNPTSSCTGHEYTDSRALEHLFPRWKVVSWGRVEHELRVFKILF